ncbi:MAG: hypothetical protein Q4E88_02870 [Coriobacteriia bacterium]|nr:hypothetical protein [Coriobacteriia bacterium]
MSKKTAFDCLLDCIYWDTFESDCANHCPIWNRDCGCENSNDVCSPIDKELCKKKLKQHFQQQADIPDGWEVVKEIYEELKKDIEKYSAKRNDYRDNKDGDYEQYISWGAYIQSSHAIRNRIRNKLQQAGIEVE